MRQIKALQRKPSFHCPIRVLNAEYVSVNNPYYAVEEFIYHEVGIGEANSAMLLLFEM